MYWCVASQQKNTLNKLTMNFSIAICMCNYSSGCVTYFRNTWEWYLENCRDSNKDISCTFLACLSQGFRAVYAKTHVHNLYKNMYMMQISHVALDFLTTIPFQQRKLTCCQAWKSRSSQTKGNSTL